MAEAKPIASLSSGLLARKGAARPAMRRPAFSQDGVAAAVGHDDLGWNDMGYDVDPDPNTPMDYDHEAGFNSLANVIPESKPEVKIQQERIAEQLHVQAEEIGIADHGAEQVAAEVVEITKTARKMPVTKSAPKAAAGSKAKSAFTLRIDAERHLKLRLACAVSNRSAQQLVTSALDAFIDAMPEISQLASQIPSSKAGSAF